MKEWLYKATEVRGDDAPRPDYETTRALAEKDGIICRSAYSANRAWIPNVQYVKAGHVIHFFYRRPGARHEFVGSFSVLDPGVARLNDDCDLALVQDPDLEQRLRDAYGAKVGERITGWLLEPAPDMQPPSPEEPDVAKFLREMPTLTAYHGSLPYEATRIRRLYVRGYRSIKELDLADLPPIVVLHGENGAGKSNILRALTLPLRWLGSEGALAATREESTRLDYVSADTQLGIRRDDFNRSSPHEMQFRLEIEIGSRARQSVGNLPHNALFEIDVVVQDVGDGIRWWVARAQIGEGFSLTGDEAQHGAGLRQEIEQAKASLAQVQSLLRAARQSLQNPLITSPQRAQLTGQVPAWETQAKQHRYNIEFYEQQLAGDSLTMDRVRSRLLRRDLVRVSGAYRRIEREPIANHSEFEVDAASLTAPEQIQRRLYLLATSSDPRERAVRRTLEARLGEAMGVSVELAAFRNNEFREYETQWSRANLEGIPLTNLGTGEQQLLILLLDVLVSATPVVQIEEPEAHLHKSLMLRLAKLLERVVEKHDVDQLFIATHHHAFAIASTYYDVTYDDEYGTRAIPTEREKASKHFYEPGPLWDALRALVASGLRENAVLFRDEFGNPVHAREVLASIEQEGLLAKTFVEEMTKTIILSMREEAEFGES